MERIKNLFSRLKFKNKSKEKNSNETGNGNLYSVWLLILPLLFGITLGRLASVCLGYGLDKFSTDSGVSTSITVGEREKGKSEEKSKGFEEFLSANPFKISPLKPPSVDVAPKAVEPPPVAENKLEDLVLRGTLPNIGAWIEDKGNLKLLLVGKTYEKYKMTSVSEREAIFRKGRERVIKKIVYGPVAQKAKKDDEKPKPPAKKAAAAPEKKEEGNIVAATPGGQEGEVPSEMLNQLVQNPFDEMKRIRMRPNEKAGGLEVQWIQNESILKRLGVQRGDVIKSVNGIPFTNMGDIANSINSLMNSERFDVEVTRGGNPTALRYVVR